MLQSCIILLYFRFQFILSFYSHNFGSGESITSYYIFGAICHLITVKLLNAYFIFVCMHWNLDFFIISRLILYLSDHYWTSLDRRQTFARRSPDFLQKVVGLSLESRCTTAGCCRTTADVVGPPPGQDLIGKSQDLHWTFAASHRTAIYYYLYK